jgi:hypothetical protein
MDIALVWHTVRIFKLQVLDAWCKEIRFHGFLKEKTIADKFIDDGVFFGRYREGPTVI